MTPTRLTLGTQALAMPHGVANRAGPLSAAEAHRLLELALELGVRSFDTAPGYGLAEERLGDVVRGLDDVYVTTRLPSMSRTGVTQPYLARAVAAAIDRSLGELGRIDAYLIDDVRDLRIFGTALVDVLQAELGHGRIGRFGASVHSPEDVQLVLDHRKMTAIQLPMSLLDQRMLAVLPKLAARGVVVFARSAFLQGLYALPLDQVPERLAHTRPWLAALLDVTTRHHTTPLAAALPFMMDVEAVDSVVIGVDSRAQLEANVTASLRPLPGGAALAAELRETFARVPLEVIEPSRWAAA